VKGENVLVEQIQTSAIPCC